MSVEGTPLLLIPEGTAQHIGNTTYTIGEESTDIEVYMEPLELPANEAKRKVCKQHIDEGALMKLHDDFMLAGTDMVTARREGLERLQIACTGCSGWLGRKACGLTLTQYDKAGKAVSSMRAKGVSAIK